MDSSTKAVAHELLDVVPVIMRTIRTEMRSQRSADLAVPQFRALLFINQNPGSSLLAVAHHLGLPHVGLGVGALQELQGHIAEADKDDDAPAVREVEAGAAGEPEQVAVERG